MAACRIVQPPWSALTTPSRNKGIGPANKSWCYCARSSMRASKHHVEGRINCVHSKHHVLGLEQGNTDDCLQNQQVGVDEKFHMGG